MATLNTDELNVLNRLNLESKLHQEKTRSIRLEKKLLEMQLIINNYQEQEQKNKSTEFMINYRKTLHTVSENHDLQDNKWKFDPESGEINVD